MGQLAEAVADAQLALSLDPSNKEIETQLKGLSQDLRDASTAKLLQQQLQQPAAAVLHAAISENSSPQELPHHEPKMQVSDAKSPLSSLSATAASSREATAAVKPSSQPAPATAGPAAAPSESSAHTVPLPTPFDPRLVSANSLLQVTILTSSTGIMSHSVSAPSPLVPRPLLSNCAPCSFLTRSKPQVLLFHLHQQITRVLMT